MEGKLCIGIFVVLCLAWSTQAAVNCTGPGRFPEPTDTTCKNYTLCVWGINGRYIAFNYTCPTTSRFNPATGRCSMYYVCNVTLPTNPPTSSVCTDEGLVADPNSTDCTNYIQCISENGVYVEYKTPCPNNTFFNPNTTNCEESYVCKTFECSSTGRYAEPADKTCKTYYLCVLESDGAYTRWEYKCPSISVFNPNTHLCTTKYKCP